VAGYRKSSLHPDDALLRAAMTARTAHRTRR
jgi:hypothetical protein